ncbi:MAG TPA: NFACT RNA binding domain-containing protein [Thermodesulfobacteriota bacterium]
MDLLAVVAVAREVDEAVRGAILSRVVQTAPETLVLEWWAGGRGERRLVVSAEPDAPRLHLTALAASALRELPPPHGGPPRFAAFLRAHTRGMRLLEVRHAEADRVVTLRLARPGDDGERLDLVVELLGAQAQVVAVGADGRVREALRRTAAAGGRTLAPGTPYVPPPPGSRRPFAELPQAVAALRARGETDPAPLGRTVAGVTPALVAHLAAAAAGNPARLAAAAEALAARLAEGRFEPRVYRRQGAAPLLAMAPLAHLEGAPDVETERFASPSAAVERWAASPEERLARRAAPLRARLLKARDRLVRRLAALDRDRANLEAASAARRLADLLAAQRHRLARGQREARVVDLFDPEGREITVPLDPALDPQANIEALYARARKAERGADAVAARRADTEAELAWLDATLFTLDAADSADDLDAIEAEIEEQSPLASPPAAGGRGPGRATARHAHPTEPKAPRGPRAGAGAQAGRPGRASAEPPVRRFRTSDGYEVVAGKTNVSNDYVSTRLARPDDLWLHADGYPGAHVLIRRAGRGEIPERSVLEAAAVAAYYSKARAAGKVSVHVAPASAVRKPRGARPGLVTLGGGHRSVVVAPDPALIARLATIPAP